MWIIRALNIRDVRREVGIEMPCPCFLLPIVRTPRCLPPSRGSSTALCPGTSSAQRSLLSFGISKPGWWGSFLKETGIFLAKYSTKSVLLGSHLWNLCLEIWADFLNSLDSSCQRSSTCVKQVWIADTVASKELLWYYQVVVKKGSVEMLDKSWNFSVLSKGRI